MKCFYHPESDAVGVCHCCQRGVCPQCAQEAGKAIACKGRCEQDVLALEELAPTRERVKRDQRDFRIISVVFLILGVLLVEWCALGIILLHNYHDTISLLFCGCFLLVIGGIQYYYQRKIGQQDTSERWRQ